MSCLTDVHFQGSFDDLRAVREAVDLPVLCKDFMLRPAQLLEARRQGADCILLIVAALEPPHLRDMIKEAQALGLHILCETHTEHEIERALAAGAQIIGVNNRDLHTFEVDVQRAIQQTIDAWPELLELAPEDVDPLVLEDLMRLADRHNRITNLFRQLAGRLGVPGFDAPEGP